MKTYGFKLYNSKRNKNFINRLMRQISFIITALQSINDIIAY